MLFQIFAREGCEVCEKAKDILSRFGVDIKVRFIDGPNATPEDIADFAWFGWTDFLPLIIVIEKDKVLKRWDGKEITDESKSWYLEVKRWLESISEKPLTTKRVQ